MATKRKHADTLDDYAATKECIILHLLDITFMLNKYGAKSIAENLNTMIMNFQSDQRGTLTKITTFLKSLGMEHMLEHFDALLDTISNSPADNKKLIHSEKSNSLEVLSEVASCDSPDTIHIDIPVTNMSSNKMVVASICKFCHDNRHNKTIPLFVYDEIKQQVEWDSIGNVKSADDLKEFEAKFLSLTTHMYVNQLALLRGLFYTNALKKFCKTMPKTMFVDKYFSSSYTTVLAYINCYHIIVLLPPIKIYPFEVVSVTTFMWTYLFKNKPVYTLVRDIVNTSDEVAQKAYAELVPTFK